MEGKIKTVAQESVLFTYKRRPNLCSTVEDFDFFTLNSFLTQDTKLSPHCGILDITDGILERRTKESPDPCILPRRNDLEGSTSGDQKVVSPSRQSKRINKSTANLRQPLSDILFDHCFRNIWKDTPEARKFHFTYMSCFLFHMYTMEDKREIVLTWIKNENIFSKRYVFIPIVFEYHWFLLVFCHFGESLDSKSTSPFMVLLDSFHAYDASPKLVPLIRRFVLDIFEIEGRSESKDMVHNIPLFIPKVPQQRNGFECGIFVLYYIYLFLNISPKRFSPPKGYPIFLNEEWFTEKELEAFYEKLEYLGLESSDEEDL